MTNFKPFNTAIDELAIVLAKSKESLVESVDMLGDKIVECLKKGGKLLTAGNGGSAADALHLSEELVGRYSAERRSLPAICLNSDVTALTCIGNDYGFEYLYSRQLSALGQANDIFVGFTTSGNSQNIIKAVEVAKEKNILSIILTGKDGGKIKGLADHLLIVPSNNTARIQEVHTLILHQWLEKVDATDWSI